jgi:hypothetical protein
MSGYQSAVVWALRSSMNCTPVLPLIFWIKVELPISLGEQVSA